MKLKKATKEDSQFFFNLRNKEYVYKVCRRARKIKKSEHNNWFNSMLKKKDCLLYVILYNGKRVGQVRLDFLEKDTAEISISLLKKYHGKGIATSAIKQSIEILKSRKIKKIIVEIKKDNFASINLFKKFGFRIIEVGNNFNKFKYVVFEKNRE